MNPVVSVVIPTYNQAGLLEKALKSVICQSFQDWEVIVIDNYSADDTQNIVENTDDARIHYIKYHNHGVIAASRNKGISLAKGAYIAFLDSDDLWYPDKLETCLTCLSRGKDAVCHGMKITKDGTKGYDFIPRKPGPDFYATLLYKGNSFITTSTVVMRKELLEKYGGFSEKPEIVTAEDYDLWLRLIKNQILWGVIPEILGEYAMHGTNSSNNVMRQMKAEYAVLQDHVKDMKDLSLATKMRIKKRQTMISLRAGRRLQQNGQWRESIPFFLGGVISLFRNN